MVIPLGVNSLIKYFNKATPKQKYNSLFRGLLKKYEKVVTTHLLNLKSLKIITCINKASLTYKIVIISYPVSISKNPT